MPEWTVWIDRWQQECCGEHFAVGSEVAWRLGVVTAEPCDDGLLNEAAFDVLASPEPEADDPSHAGPVLLRGGLAAQWLADEPHPPLGEARRLRGLLVQEHHDGVSPEVPPTRGNVLSLFVASHRYVADGPRSFHRDGETRVTLLAVEDAPGRFVKRPEVASAYQAEDGLVAVLAVQDP